MGGRSMFDDEPQVKEREPVDYTGPKVVAILAPVFFLVAYLSDKDTGLTVCLVLGAVILAIKLRWKLRKHVWFWAIIVFILALHLPLISIIRWKHGNIPTLAFSLPIGIVDFLLIMGAIGFAEKFFPKGSSADDEEEE
jgi:hypothetical protein